MDLEISKTCRGCLAVSATSEELVSFEKEGVLDLFLKCTSIQITEIDALPQQICRTCLRECQKWNNFRLKCKQSDRCLHSMISIEESSSSAVGLTRNENLIMDIDDGFETVSETSSSSGTLEGDENDPRDLKTKSPTEDHQNEILNEDSSSMDSRYEEWICPVCYMEMNDTLELRHHMKSHISNQDPKCPICEKGFSRSSKVFAHISSSHLNKTATQNQEKSEVGKQKCHLCSKRVENLSSHMRKHFVKKSPFVCNKSVIMDITGDMVCPLCSVFFLDYETFKEHVFSDHVKEENIKCRKCHLYFNSGRDLIEHLFTRHMECLFWCTNCAFQVSSPQEMGNHLKDVHDFEKEMCPICGKWSQSMALHKRIHLAR